jgi:hypothetical protein
MEGPDGIGLNAEVGPTDRGTLWRASRERDGDRIVRFVEPRYCDEQFRQGLRSMRDRPSSQLLRIVGEGWSGAHYYIEYEVEPPWQTIEERLAGCAPWPDGIELLRPVCRALPDWWRSPVHPLGLNLRNVVLTEAAGPQRPWLLPCPAIAVTSPCDLFGLDSTVVAALAPEMVRGVGMDHRAQDIYALGTLAAQAAGCTAGVLPDAARVEAQARGALLVASPDRWPVATPLAGTAQWRRLFQTVARYRHTVPEARPNDAVELQAALAAAADPITLADGVQQAEPDRALTLLAPLTAGTPAGPADPVRQLRALRLAAEITQAAADWPAVLVYLDRAVGLEPDLVDLHRWRCEVLWQVFQADRADLGDDLLRELDRIKPMDPDASATPYLRAAEVHQRRGDNHAVAAELYGAAERDPADLRTLKRYAIVLSELGGRSEAAAVQAMARRRIRGMVAVGMLTAEEGARWTREFDDLHC